MKAKILVSLLVIFFISSCEKKEEISSQVFEDTISNKSTPTEFSRRPSKADYELYSQEMFALANDVVSYAASQGNDLPFLDWSNSTWEMYSTLYLVENYPDDFDELMSTYTLYFNEYYSGNVLPNFEPWQIEVFNTIEANLNDIDVDNFYSESMIYLDEVFDSVYALQSIPPSEMDQTLSSIMIYKGSIEFIYENTELNRGPWGWKRIVKCVAGTTGGYMLGGVGGIGAGVALAGYLGMAVATGGASIVISVAVVGAAGGAIAGSNAGDCWDD